MSPQPWFRFYSEMLSDRKIEYLCRATNQPKALIIGIWATILALANDSPQRGVLLLTNDIALDIADLARETGIDVADMENFIKQFAALNMLIQYNGAFCLCNWNKRQFISDNSTERVRRWREQQNVNGCNSASDDNSNVIETLQDSYSNGPETETDTETDTETEEINGADAPSAFPKTPEPESKKQLTAELVDFFSATTGLPRPPTETKTQCKAANRLWWTPLLKIAGEVDNDAERAKALIRHTIGYMDSAKEGQGLTISSPASILKTAISEQARRKRGSVSARGQPSGKLSNLQQSLKNAGLEGEDLWQP